MKIEKNVAILGLVLALAIGMASGIFIGSDFKSGSADLINPNTSTSTSTKTESITLGQPGDGPQSSGNPGSPPCSEDSNFENQVKTNVDRANGYAYSLGGATYNLFVMDTQRALEDRARKLRNQMINFYQQSYHDRTAAEAAFNANVQDFADLGIWLKNNSDGVIKSAHLNTLDGAVKFFDTTQNWYKLFKRYGKLFEKSNNYDVSKSLDFATTITIDQIIAPKLTVRGLYKLGDTYIKGNANYICDGAGIGASSSYNRASFNAELAISLPAVKTDNGTITLDITRTLSGETSGSLNGKLRF